MMTNLLDCYVLLFYDSFTCKWCDWKKGKTEEMFLDDTLTKNPKQIYSKNMSFIKTSRRRLSFERAAFKSATE